MNPFSQSAVHFFRFCVPEEWYRRPRSASSFSSALRRDASDSTIMPESEEHENDSDHDDTAKAARSSSSQSSTTESKSFATDEKGSLSARRLSNLFDGWLTLSSSKPPADRSRPSTPSSVSERPSVSEPMLFETPFGRKLSSDSLRDIDDSDSDESLEYADFERMVRREER